MLLLQRIFESLLCYDSYAIEIWLRISTHHSYAPHFNTFIDKLNAVTQSLVYVNLFGIFRVSVEYYIHHVPNLWRIHPDTKSSNFFHLIHKNDARPISYFDCLHEDCIFRNHTQRERERWEDNEVSKRMKKRKQPTDNNDGE